MAIFINRILNLRRIKAIGLDMDHTLIRYNSENFEHLTHQVLVDKLIHSKNYPELISQIPFQWNLVIRGLAIDKRRGNILKMSRHGKVKQASHGTRHLGHLEVKDIYEGLVIDLNDPNFEALDTTFSIAQIGLIAQLIDLAESLPEKFPNFEKIANDVKQVLDLAHRDGSLKNEVIKDVANFIVQDPALVETLERFKLQKKLVIVVTNSDYAYTKLLLDYAINPFLKNYRHWSELFDMTITLSNKPRFFTDSLNFLEVDPSNGMLKNIQGPLSLGKIYQGGSSKKLQTDLGLEGEEILYLGDHIYGDILSLKKSCNWRTALVIEEIEDETLAFEKGHDILGQIDQYMELKEQIEDRLDQAVAKRDQSLREKLSHEIEQVNQRIQIQLGEYKKLFNPHWGEVLRAGQEESRLMGQVEKYACLYMARVTDFLKYSPRKYFRPKRRPLAHEIKERPKSLS